MSDLQKKVEDLRSSVSKLKETFSVESKDSLAKLDRLRSLYRKQDYWRDSVNNIDAIPGVRQPHWYVVEIPFQHGDSNVRANEVIVSAEGAFVCSQVQSYYLITDEDSSHYNQINYNAAGRVVPTSAFTPYTNALKVLGYATALTFCYNSSQGESRTGAFYPEFEFQIEIEGSGRFWASPKIPAKSFYGVNKPFDLGMQGIVENVDKIKVYAYPTSPIELDGTVRFVFHGHSIGSSVTLQNRKSILYGGD